MTKPTKTPRAESLPVGSIWAPRFGQIKGGRLYAAGPMSRVKKRAPRDLLDRFCRIAEAEDTEKAVVSFAKQWGLLGLCKHGLPVWHNMGNAGRICNESYNSVDGHKDFARCLEALRRVGLEVNDGNPGENVDWELADSILCGPDFPGRTAEMLEVLNLLPKDLACRRNELQSMMRRLTTICRVQPRFHWDGSAWAIDFDSFERSNLPAILTLQLMATIGGAPMRKCRDCPQWFRPNGRQVYCRSCGKRASWRAASQRSRDARKTKTKSPKKKTTVHRGGNRG